MHAHGMKKHYSKIICDFLRTRGSLSPKNYRSPSPQNYRNELMPYSPDLPQIRFRSHCTSYSIYAYIENCELLFMSIHLMSIIQKSFLVKNTSAFRKNILSRILCKLKAHLSLYSNIWCDFQSHDTEVDEHGYQFICQ